MIAPIILVGLFLGCALVCLYGYLGARRDDWRRWQIERRGRTLFIPPEARKPAGLSPAASMLWDALQTFGAYKTDRFR